MITVNIISYYLSNQCNFFIANYIINFNYITLAMKTNVKDKESSPDYSVH